MPDVFRVDVPVAGTRIACLLHLPDRVPAPALVCCHGLLSHKDSSKYAALGEMMCSAGLGVVRFDFSGCGESTKRGGPFLDARLTDLCGVLDFVLGQGWCNGRIALFGSSMGGYLALLLAGTKAYSIEALVCWATPFTLNKVQASVEQSAQMNHRLSGFEGFGEPMDLSGLAAVQCTMVVHGQRDETVPWWEAALTYKRLGEPKRLLVLENGDHRLTDPTDRDVALNASLDWIRERGLLPTG